MKLLRRKRPVKAAGYRSNEWKGPRAVQVRDYRQRARQFERLARCRRALRLLGWLAGAAAVCWTVLLLSRQLGPVLHRGLEIKQVLVEGTHQVTKQEVIDRLALKKGLAQYQVSLSYLAERVRTHPWIKEATVERLPLHELRVTVVERTPAAILRLGSEQVLTDDEGVILARLGIRDDATLPLVTGVDGTVFAQGDLRIKHRIQSAVELARWMAESVDGRIELDMTHPVNLVASARGVRFHFGSDALKDQWERFMKVKAAFRVPALDGRKQEGHDVDLRYDNRVIVRERG
jgi:cell division protein FtsQ